jgi:hypothetical protein
MAPIVELGEHEYWDHEIFRGFAQQCGAPRVIRIGRVECGQQRTGVQDESQS